MKLYVYTLCKNEIKIAPFIVKYWQNVADKLIVYDNGSTDGTSEYLNQFDWIEVREGNSINKGMNDFLNQQLKNSCWNEARLLDVDFVYVCDFDEVLWSPNLKLSLREIKDYNIIKTHIFFISAETFPNTDVLVHEQKGVLLQPPNYNYNGLIVTKYRGFEYGKIQLFLPKYINDMRFTIGNHDCFPEGYELKVFDCIENNIPIIMFHLTPLNWEYFISKINTRSKQLSSVNRKTIFGKLYEISELEAKQEFELFRKGISWNELKCILKIN